MDLKSSAGGAARTSGTAALAVAASAGAECFAVGSNGFFGVGCASFGVGAGGVVAAVVFCITPGCSGWAAVAVEVGFGTLLDDDGGVGDCVV